MEREEFIQIINGMKESKKFCKKLKKLVGAECIEIPNNEIGIGIAMDSIFKNSSDIIYNWVFGKKDDLIVIDGTEYAIGDAGKLFDILSNRE